VAAGAAAAFSLFPRPRGAAAAPTAAAPAARAAVASCAASGDRSALVFYVAMRAAMDVKATYLAAYLDSAWPSRAAATAALTASLLVPVALAGPCVGGVAADRLARSRGRRAFADQAAAAAAASAAATAVALGSSDFGAATAAVYVGILADGFAMAPLLADVQRGFPKRLLGPGLALAAAAATLVEDGLELGLGGLDGANGALGADIALALAAAYAAALAAAARRVLRPPPAAAVGPRAPGGSS